jgi:hypothetical protein
MKGRKKDSSKKRETKRTGRKPRNAKSKGTLVDAVRMVRSGVSLKAGKRPAAARSGAAARAIDTTLWEEEAIAISRNIQDRHLPFGTILDPIFAAPDSEQIANYTRAGDSAIWTGHYLAAEARDSSRTRASTSSCPTGWPASTASSKHPLV